MFEYKFEFVGKLPGQPKQRRYGRNRSIPWRDRLVPLMERPGVWACLGVGDDNIYGQATNLNTGHYTLPEGHEEHFEFAARTVEGEKRLYGRYIGPAVNGVSFDAGDEGTEEEAPSPSPADVANAWAR